MHKGMLVIMYSVGRSPYRPNPLFAPWCLEAWRTLNIPSLRGNHVYAQWWLQGFAGFCWSVRRSQGRQAGIEAPRDEEGLVHEAGQKKVEVLLAKDVQAKWRGALKDDVRAP